MKIINELDLRAAYRFAEFGGVVTEFAIVLPILILLIQGVASFGL